MSSITNESPAESVEPSGVFEETPKPRPEVFVDGMGNILNFFGNILEQTLIDAENKVIDPKK